MRNGSSSGRRRVLQRRLGALAFALCAALAGCSSIVSNSTFKHKELDLGALKKVAVMPFQNFASDPHAGERVATTFASELLATQLFQVVDPAQTTDYLATAKMDPRALGEPEMKKMKEALKVDAIVFGSADEYAVQTVGQDTFPVVTVSARLVDCATGTVLWMNTVSGTGDPKVPIVALGRIKTLPEMAQIVCRQVVLTLKK